MPDVTLHDGRRVDDASEAYRAELEALDLLAMPLDKRRAWLADLDRIRGVEATNYLRANMTELHAAGKGETS